MDNKYFSPEESLADITDRYPELIAVLSGKGFAQLKDEKKRLKAASRGLDWLKERISIGVRVEELADVFISAGFDLFFDRRFMDHFWRQAVFKDVSGINSLNQDFKDNEIDLLDPEGDYSVLGIVPAVFLINRAELGDRKAPKTWADILSEEFTGSVSLPVTAVLPILRI